MNQKTHQILDVKWEQKTFGFSKCKNPNPEHFFVSEIDGKTKGREGYCPNCFEKKWKANKNE